MGVLTCSRKDCNNIMCDTYIPHIGYICIECIEEFIEETEKFGTEQHFFNKLSHFVEKERSLFDDKKEINITEFFDKYTP